MTYGGRGRHRLVAAAAVVIGLSACDGGSVGGQSVDLSVSGDAAVGASASSGGATNFPAGGARGGPPPGRTDAERQGRKNYYRGPRGQEF